MLEATIFTSTGVGVTIAFGSTRYFTAVQNVGRVKSSVDDLTMERGTVSMRVAFVLRSAEVQPLFRDLCDAPFCVVVLPILSPPVAFQFCHTYYGTCTHVRITLFCSNKKQPLANSPLPLFCCHLSQ